MVLSLEAEDELIAMQAIFPDNVEVQENGRLVYSIMEAEGWRLHISLNSGYPENEKPNLLMIDYVGNVSEYKNNQKAYKFLLKKCEGLLDRLYEHSECLFSLFDELTISWPTYMTEVEDELDIQIGISELKLDDSIEGIENIDPFEGWIVSDPIEDRGSTFISYAYPTNNEAEAFKKLILLKTDNKIARSRHVMFAYRFEDEKTGNIISDCDDDGETAAGSRMLHLLTLMDAKNVFVACARWFTGTHIGPDRFKHINTTTRDVVIKGGFSRKEEDNKKSSSKIKKK